MLVLKRNCSAVACQCVYFPNEKECPCCLCSIVRVTMTCECAFQVTPFDTLTAFVRCSSSEKWVAMRSWSLDCLNTSLERSVDHDQPLDSMCSLDEGKVCLVRISFSAPDRAVEGGDAWELAVSE